MQKFFVDENQIKDDKVEITGDDVNHIANVLRMQKGEQFLIGNNSTLETFLTEILNIEKDRVIVNIIEKLELQTESNVEIDLYQGLPKADKMELIIQKTTEIGVSKIIPVEMARCIVKLDEKDAKKKIERWQKVAEGAAKQSKRDKIPKIEEKIKLKDIQSKIDEYDIFLIAYEEEIENSLKRQLKMLNKKEKYKIGVLVGPEGGIAKEEIEMLKGENVKLVTLGKRILRTETAPIVITSNIIYELED